MMWWNRSVEAALSALRAENSDLRQQLRLERAEWAEERERLIDRILALDRPAALREVRRAPQSQGPTNFSPQSERPRRINQPGYAPYQRPPFPPHPPAPGTISLSDHEVQAVKANAEIPDKES